MPPPFNLQSTLDIQLTLNIQYMLENRSTPNVTSLVLHLWKKFFYTLTLKNLDKQSFFIVNSGKAGRCHPCFIHKISRCHPHSINRSTGRSYPYATIEKVICKW